ncbi:unnamed protein product [Closterium sp. NIES-53]
MAAQELRWLTYLLTDLGEQPRSPPVLYVDNKAMLALCREHRLEHRTKHIALRYFLARELQQRGQLRLAYVASEANTADIFTKALAPGDHQRFCTMLGLLALLCLTSLSSLPPPQPAVVDCRAETAGAEPGGAETEGEGSGGVATGGAATGGADSGGAESPSGGGAVGDPAGGPGAGQPPQPDLLETLSPQRFVPGSFGAGAAGGTGGAGAAEPGGPAGAGGAGGPAGGAAGVGGTRGATGAGRTGATSPAVPRGAGGAAGAGDAGATTAGGTGAASAGGPAGTGGTGPAGALCHLLGLPPAPTEFPVAGTTPPLLFPQLLPHSPLPAPAPYTAVTKSLIERRELETRASTPERREPETRASACAHVPRVRRSRAPAVPGTHDMLHSELSYPAAPHLATMLLAPEGDPDALDIPTPRSYREAISDTYVNEVPPPGANIVSGMWIFRVKRPPGSPPAFKAHYVARRFSQREGVDFFQTFSPTLKMTPLRWSLRRPVYGLRQAPREWHDTLRTTLAALGFAPSTSDPSLFLRTDTTLPPFYVLVYVDDLVFAIADTEALALVKAKLQERHTCTDLGPSALRLQDLLATAHSSVYRPLALSSTFGRVLHRAWGSCLEDGVHCCEAEIYVGAMAAQELRWLTYLLSNSGERPRSPPVMYLRRQPRLSYVALRANTADVFTKALGFGDHQRFCTALGLVPTLPHLLVA